jgi:2-polyprenyl-3-methyl-5-hydroxy-6-metoxy-1,4-benzoquinol methylase
MNRISIQPYFGPCNLCGGTDFVALWPGNIAGRSTERFSQYAWYNDIHRCRHCGLVAQAPLHETRKIYELIAGEKYLDEAIGEMNLREKTVQFDQLIGFIRRHTDLAGKRLLDAGANTGVFIHTVTKLGVRADGIEPSSEACDVARRQFGLATIQNAVIGKADLPRDAYDIVTLWDVIEHLVDPLGDLRALRDAVKPGGRIFISTHDIETGFAKLCGARNPMLMYQHFYHFSPATLSGMVRKAGFEPVAVHKFRKSWTVRYFLHLFEKSWPGSLAARAARGVLRRLEPDSALLGRRVSFPFREFFVLVAERPTQ